MSLADDILSTSDRLPLDFEAWGKELRLMPISGRDRDSFDQLRVEHQSKGTWEHWRARYLVRCIYDRSDPPVRVFTDDQAEALAEKNGELLKTIWDKAQAMNGEGPGAVTFAAKNS